MPGKKRKAGGTSNNMWGNSGPSSSSNSSSSRRKASSSSSRRGGKNDSVSGIVAGGLSSGINAGEVEKIFGEICDDDNPGTASMEGEFEKIGESIYCHLIPPRFSAPSLHSVSPPC